MTRPLGCREAVRQLWSFLDQGRAPADDPTLEAHLAFCLRCCGELEFARELQQVLRDQTSVDPPTDVRDRLERFIDELGTGTR
jgi:hypothetical protein